MSSWHPDPRALEIYAGGGPDGALAASVEAHLIACPACRSAVAPYADRAVVRAGRNGLADRLEHRRRPLLVRCAERMGLSDGDAVLLTASRAMADAWLGAVLVVFVVGALAGLFTGGLGRIVFVLAAPLVPVVNVALVYLNTEPSLERLARSTPYSSFRLVLLRTVAVLVTALPLCLLAGLVVGGLGSLLFAWLLPALALTSLVLALSTWAPVELVAAAVSVGWALLIGTLGLTSDPLAAVSIGLQPVHLALALLATFTVLARLRRGHVPGGTA